MIGLEFLQRFLCFPERKNSERTVPVYIRGVRLRREPKRKPSFQASLNNKIMALV